VDKTTNIIFKPTKGYTKIVTELKRVNLHKKSLLEQILNNESKIANLLDQARKLQRQADDLGMHNANLANQVKECHNRLSSLVDSL